MSGNSETHIINKLENGDPEGLKHLFELYYKRLCLFAMNYIDSYTVCEDIVQECFIKLWDTRSSRVFTGSIYSYLFASVRNNSLQYLKVNNKHIYEEFENHTDMVYEADLSEEELEEKKRKIYEEIEKLPPRCKAVFELVVLENKKYKDAAEELGISTNTVKTQLSKAIKILKSNVNLLPLFLLP